MRISSCKSKQNKVTERKPETRPLIHTFHRIQDSFSKRPLKAVPNSNDLPENKIRKHVTQLVNFHRSLGFWKPKKQATKEGVRSTEQKIATMGNDGLG